MGEGLAAMATNTYGTGSDNTIKHYYAGPIKTKKKKGK